jgi:hypothetical protein
MTPASITTTAPARPGPRAAPGHCQPALGHAVDIIYRICCLAGPLSFVDDIRRSAAGRRVRAAIRNHDIAAIFDWLMSELSYQGVSDRVAANYIADHGNVRWADVDAALRAEPSCPKLRGYWRFHDCGYHKTSQTCNEPEHIERCRLPGHVLRNGRLNQLAYSLFLFMRDAAGGDLVGWIDGQVNGASAPDDVRAALIEPLRNVYGVSDKTLAMALSFLLIAAAKKHWFDVGAGFVVVDTLVHNFLHRTGILGRFNADHGFGPRCYQPGGCAEILVTVARAIDASKFNPQFPPFFPRFIQIGIWSYCAESGLDVCNGTRIDDRGPCGNAYCQVRGSCDRVSLRENAENDVFSLT